MAGEVIRVLIVDDDPLVRSALRLMLGGAEDIEIVGEAGDGASAVQEAETVRPAVVLMDIRMPVMDGLEATRVLHSEPDPPRVIVLTTFDADDYVVSAVASGADGFLLKDTAPADIVAAVRRVADGEAMLSPSAARSLIRQVRAQGPAESRCDATDKMESLTEREREVAVAVAQGLSNADIAANLFMSVPTVKAHVSKLLEKMQATNRVQIAIYVHEAGLV